MSAGLHYLSTRNQYVMVDDCVSDALYVHSGVAQGPVLAQLLFLVYINGLQFSVQFPGKSEFLQTIVLFMPALIRILIKPDLKMHST